MGTFLELSLMNTKHKRKFIISFTESTTGKLKPFLFNGRSCVSRQWMTIAHNEKYMYFFTIDSLKINFKKIYAKKKIKKKLHFKFKKLRIFLRIFKNQ